MQKTTKFKQIQTHLTKRKKITSWEAFDLYGVTRLSAVIFVLRDRGWVIDSTPKTKIDRNGNSCTYSLYTLVSLPKEN